MEGRTTDSTTAPSTIASTTDSKQHKAQEIFFAHAANAVRALTLVFGNNQRLMAQPLLSVLVFSQPLYSVYLTLSHATLNAFALVLGPDDEPGAAVRPSAVPYSEAVLAHIWPNTKAVDAEVLVGLLRLPPDFHVQPRNFLVLHKEAEAAFDSEALLLFPSRTPTLAATARLFRSERISGGTPDETAAKRAHLTSFAQRRLFLPLAGEGRVPFMRLLAWKAVSALRAREEEDEAGLADGLPDELDMNATTTSRDDGVVVAAVQRLRVAGFKFRTVE